MLQTVLEAMKKPGALKNSLALKSIPQLKSIYDNYFNKNSKEFIEIIRKNKEQSLDELFKILSEYYNSPINIIKFDQTKSTTGLNDLTRTQTSKYNSICIGDVGDVCRHAIGGSLSRGTWNK